mgnify:CR=1 FL=1
MTTTLEHKINNTQKVKLKFIPTEITRQKINECIEKNIFYGIFPVVGDSMTCNDIEKSIPDGSKVLVYDLQINLNNGLSSVWHEIPTKKTLLIGGKTSNEKPFFLCKSIISVDAVNGYVLLDSYNKQHGSKWIPFDWITNIYEVVQIV